MIDVVHRIGVQGGTPERVYEALATVEGLAEWWTRDTTGDAGVDGVIAFRFLPGGFDMVVVGLVPPPRGQPGITVRHENLRVGVGPSTSHTPTGGSLQVKTRPLLPTS